MDMHQRTAVEKPRPALGFVVLLADRVVEQGVEPVGTWLGKALRICGDVRQARIPVVGPLLHLRMPIRQVLAVFVAPRILRPFGVSRHGTNVKMSGGTIHKVSYRMISSCG